MLHDFAKADQDWLDDLMRGISDGADPLAAGDWGKFQNAVSLRVNPPRSGGGEKGKATGASKGAAAAPEPSDAPRVQPDGQAQKPPAPDPAQAKSPMQRLLDRFR